MDNQESLPPGGIVLITGEILRYADAMAAVSDLRPPTGSRRAWRRSCMVAKQLNEGIHAILSHPEMEWVFIMGDDHTFTSDTIDRLLRRNEPVVAPLCLNRGAPFWPTVHQRLPERRVRIKPMGEFPKEGLYTLAANETCGDSGLLIRRHVFEAMAKQHRQTALLVDQVEAMLIATESLGLDMDNVLGQVSKDIDLVPNDHTFREIARAIVGKPSLERLARVEVPADWKPFDQIISWYEREHGSGALSAEDQVFTGKLRDAGFPVKIDMDVRIGHMTPMTVMPALNKDGVWVAQFSTVGQKFAEIEFRPPGELAPDGAVKVGEKVE